MFSQSWAMSTKQRVQSYYSVISTYYNLQSLATQDCCKKLQNSHIKILTLRYFNKTYVGNKIRVIICHLIEKITPNALCNNKTHFWLCGGLPLNPALYRDVSRALPLEPTRGSTPWPHLGDANPKPPLINMGGNYIDKCVGTLTFETN